MAGTLEEENQPVRMSKHSTYAPKTAQTETYANVLLVANEPGRI